MISFADNGKKPQFSIIFRSPVVQTWVMVDQNLGIFHQIRLTK